MGNINDKINKWPQEFIKKFDAFTTCLVEDKDLCKRHGLNLSNPNIKKAKKIIYKYIVESLHPDFSKPEDIGLYFFIDIEETLANNPGYNPKVLQ